MKPSGGDQFHAPVVQNKMQPVASSSAAKTSAVKAPKSLFEPLPVKSKKLVDDSSDSPELNFDEVEEPDAPKNINPKNESGIGRKRGAFKIPDDSTIV